MCSEFCCFHKVYQCPKVLFCYGSSVFKDGGNGILFLEQNYRTGVLLEGGHDLFEL